MEVSLLNHGSHDPRSALLGRWDVASRDASSVENQAAFASVLSRARGATEQDRADEARRAAEDFVAQALVRPVLKQMREATFASAPFAPNQAEKAFRGMMDDALAQRIVRAKGWTLVDKVRERLGMDVGARLPVESASGTPGGTR
jgi:Rod binding domain-containing protein